MLGSSMNSLLFKKPISLLIKSVFLVALTFVTTYYAYSNTPTTTQKEHSQPTTKNLDILTDVLTTNWASGNPLPLLTFIDYMQIPSKNGYYSDIVSKIAKEKNIMMCLDLEHHESDTKNTSTNADKKNTTPSAPNEKTKNIFDIQENDIVFGDPHADVIFIEYSSPTCAHCAYFHKEIYPELYKKYVEPKKIAYVVRQFIANKQDLDAAVLALCGGQDLFVKIRQVLYKQQGSWAFNTNYRDILTNIGQLSGISGEQYANCLSDEIILSKLINDSRSVTQAPNFIGTPTFVIGGKLYNQAYTYKNLSGAIEQEIKNSQKSK